MNYFGADALIYLLVNSKQFLTVVLLYVQGNNSVS